MVELEKIQENQRRVRSKLKSSPLADMTPEEIYLYLQGRIDGWTSLAQVQSDLRKWLPLLTILALDDRFPDRLTEV